MPKPADTTAPQKHFLDVADSEVVQGSDVITGKVSEAMRDADRFGMPHVKPPLSEALEEAKRVEASSRATEDPAEQNALAGKPVEVDEKAGSTEMLQPTGSTRPA